MAQNFTSVFVKEILRRSSRNLVSGVLRVDKALIFSSERIVDIYVAVILRGLVFIGQIAFVIGFNHVV